MRGKGVIIALLVAMLSLLISEIAFAYEAVEVNNGGTIDGKVIFSGNPPPPTIIEIGQDQSVCGKTREIYVVEVKEGMVKNAVARIVEIDRGKNFEFQGAVLDQEKCEFKPHVVLTSAGKFTILSSDPMPHNTHTKSILNPPINITLNRLKRKTSLSLMFPEIVNVKCDLHGWMKAFIVVAEHPYYAVTGDSGTFQFRDVPAGIYELEVWHEKLGTKSQEITVKEGKATAVEFTYTE